MHIVKTTIRASPFIGVFALVTEKFSLLPTHLEKKEEKGLEEVFGTETIKTRLAESPLLGALAVGNSNGIIASSMVEEKEARILEENGIRVKRVETNIAIGNMMKVNDTKGVCSRAIQPKMKKEIEEFLKVEMRYAYIENAETIGASVVITNKGFIVSPLIKPNEFNAIKEWMGTEGKATTANMGDPFVGNSVLANSNGIAAGIYTTPHEMLRIDEGLG